MFLNFDSLHNSSTEFDYFPILAFFFTSGLLDFLVNFFFVTNQDIPILGLSPNNEEIKPCFIFLHNFTREEVINLISFQPSFEDILFSTLALILTIGLVEETLDPKSLRSRDAYCSNSRNNSLLLNILKKTYNLAKIFCSKSFNFQIFNKIKN